MISCQFASLEIIFKFFEPFFRKDAHGAVSERNVFMAVPARFLQLFQRSFFVAKPDLNIRVKPISATLQSDLNMGRSGSPTSEHKSLIRISSARFYLTKKTNIP